MAKTPEFQLTLAKRPSPHMLETKPRYDVMVNGVKKDELYYNMRGYRGALRDVQGYGIDLGEASLAAYRREVATLNREGKEKLAAATADGDVIFSAYEVTDRDKVLVCYGKPPLDDAEESLHKKTVNRRDWEYATQFFGQADIPASFLESQPEADIAPGDTPEVDRREGDKVLAAVNSDDHSFVILAIGPVPEGMERRQMMALPQDLVAENARDFVWMTRMGWRELTAQAGRDLVDASALPLIQNRTLSAEFRPDPVPGPKQGWIHDKMRKAEVEEDLAGPTL
ncbi:hypothetical protein KUV57_12120 [Epibacterium sp. DP7N7-1]|nr:hypothetical protein [Epibacterium sp. DP7N7-1]